MHRVLGLSMVLVALAGCVTEPEPHPASGPGTATEDDTGPLDGTANATAASREIVEETIPVHFNGTLGTYAYLCEFETTGACAAHNVAVGESDVYVERIDTTLHAVHLTLSWEAASPATETLRIGAMVMGRCDACNTTMLDRQEGTSPLTIDLSDLDVPMPADHVVHAYVYNPTTFAHHPPLIAHASIEQAIQVEGAVTVMGHVSDA